MSKKIKDSKNLDIEATAIRGNIVFSQKDVTAYWTLGVVVYDFLSLGNREDKLSETLAPILGLTRGREDPIDVHLYITNAPLDVDRWEQDYRELSAGWRRYSGFNEFMRNQVEILKANQFVEKRVFLGVKIMNRKELDLSKFNPLQAGVREAGIYAKNFLSKVLQTPNDEPDDEEIAHAEKIRDELDTMLSNSSLHAVATSTEELAILLKKPFYPAMPTPYVDLSEADKWGKGEMLQDVQYVMDTKENPRWLHVQQDIDGELIDGYRTTLTFSKFPKIMRPPASIPWLYRAVEAGISSPFDISVRFTLVPYKNVKADIVKRRNMDVDESENAGEAGGLSMSSDEGIQESLDLEQMVEEDKKPWVYATARMSIEAASVKQLRKDVAIMQKTYEDSTSGSDVIKLAWTTYDQLDLLLEMMPGDHIREGSFQQRSSVEFVSASGFNIFGEVGDQN